MVVIVPVGRYSHPKLDGSIDITAIECCSLEVLE